MGFRSNSAVVAASASLLMIAIPACHAQASKPPAALHRAAAATSVHRIAVLEGEVSAGQGFERPIGNGLKLLLEPIASGWALRVVPAQGPRGPHDYAELATPPYQSVSPLLLSTDFSFRAQDALAWNPRHFRFAADAASFAALSEAFGEYQRLSRAGPNAAAPMRLAESRLATLAGRAPEGVLTILDARLVPGTGNQAQAAAMVASHPNGSARQIDQPSDGVATPLGRINWLRFRIRLDLPPGFQPDKRLKTELSTAP